MDSDGEYTASDRRKQLLLLGYLMEDSAIKDLESGKHDYENDNDTKR